MSADEQEDEINGPARYGFKEIAVAKRPKFNDDDDDISSVHTSSSSSEDDEADLWKSSSSSKAPSNTQEYSPSRLVSKEEIKKRLLEETKLVHSNTFTKKKDDVLDIIESVKRTINMEKAADDVEDLDGEEEADELVHQEVKVVATTRPRKIVCADSDSDDVEVLEVVPNDNKKKKLRIVSEDDDDINRGFKLKFRYSGQNSFVPIDPGKPIKVTFGGFIRKTKLKRKFTDLVFKFDGNVLNGDKSCSQLGLESEDQVEVTNKVGARSEEEDDVRGDTASESEEEEESEDDEEEVEIEESEEESHGPAFELKFKYEGKSHVIELDPHSKLQQAFTELRTKVNLTHANLVFKFDGSKLNGDATPVAQGLESGDQIEVVKR